MQLKSTVIAVAQDREPLLTELFWVFLANGYQINQERDIYQLGKYITPLTFS